MVDWRMFFEIYSWNKLFLLEFSEKNNETIQKFSINSFCHFPNNFEYKEKDHFSEKTISNIEQKGLKVQMC